MSSANYNLVVSAPDVRATLTPEDFRKVARPFRRGHSNGTEYEELVLDISGRLRRSVGPIKRHSKNIIEDIAVLVKILTQGRTFGEASAFIKSDEGSTWLCQWLVPKVSRGFPAVTVDPATMRTLENPRIAVAEADRNVVAEGDITARLEQVDLATELFVTPVEGRQPFPETINTVHLEAPASPLGLSPGSPRRSSAHSRTSSDVSAEFGPGRCPRCLQFHSEAIMLFMVQWLEQHGYSLNEARGAIGLSHRQSRQGRSNLRSPSIGAVSRISGSPTAIVEHRPYASLQSSTSTHAHSPVPFIIKVWLVFLSVSVVAMGVWLASK